MIQLSKLFGNNKFHLLFIVIFFSLLYLFTLPRQNIGYSSSDQLITIGHYFGLASSPGHSIYMALIYIFTHLPISDNVAFKAHLLSGVLSILTLIMIYKALNLLLVRLPENLINIPKSFLALVPVLLLGYSYNYWLYSIIAETISLHLFFTSVFIYLIIKVLLHPDENHKLHWYLIFIISGLGISHHYLFLLNLPLVLLIFFNKFPKISLHQIIRSLAVLIISFILPSLLIFLQKSSKAPVSWDIASGTNGWVTHILGKSYLNDSQSTFAVFSSIDVNYFFSNLLNYFKFTYSNTNILVLILFVIGVYQLWIWNKKLMIALFTAVLLTGPFLYLIMFKSNYVGSQSSFERLLVGNLLYLAIFAGMGLSLCINRLYLFVTTLGASGKNQIYALLLLISIYIVYGYYLNFREFNLKNFTLVSDRYATMLSQVEKDAIIVCFTEYSCSALLYEQFINNNNPEVIIIPTPYELRKKQLYNYPDLRKFLYTEDPFRTFDYITWNLAQDKPIYVVDITKEYSDILGFNQPILYYLPYGYYGRILKSPPIEIPPSDLSLTKFAIENPVSERDPMKIYYYLNLIRIHQLNSTYLIKYGYRNQAREELNYAGSLDQELSMIGVPSFFEINRKAIESSSINLSYLPEYTPASLDKFLELVQEWQYERNRLDVAHVTAVGAMAMYPDEPKAHLAVAKTFEAMGHKKSALLEYKNTLLLDDSNEEAIKGIKRLTPIDIEL